MQVGDVVYLKSYSDRVGLVVDFMEKKIWRVHDKGVKVNWDVVKPETHAVVLYSDGLMNIPAIDLEVLSETG